MVVIKKIVIHDTIKYCNITFYTSMGTICTYIIDDASSLTDVTVGSGKSIMESVLDVALPPLWTQKQNQITMVVGG